jgi:hypothetical protein
VTAVDPTTLTGHWTLSRTIDDRHGREQLSVDGVTDLVLADDGRVRWSESGVLHRRGLDSPVSRVLFVEQRDDGWWVTFDDGRDFHPWCAGSEVVHPCGADTYVGRIDVLDTDRWAVEWQVSGPAKDYTMRSTLTRSATPDGQAS